MVTTSLQHCHLALRMPKQPFTCLMNSIFRKYLETFVLVFIDDIMIYSKDEEEHKEHLKLVLQTLRDHQLYAKFSKCEFQENRIQYLEHIISKEGLAVDVENIRCMVNWLIQKDVSTIRSFIEIVGYCTRFIDGFSRLSYRITSLYKKGVKFKWSRQC